MTRKIFLGLVLLLLPSLQLGAQKPKYPEMPVFKASKAPGLRDVCFMQDNMAIHNFLYSYDVVRKIPYCVAYMLQPHQLIRSSQGMPDIPADWIYDNAYMYRYQSGDWSADLAYQRYSLVPSIHRNTKESMRQTRMRTLTVPAVPSVVHNILTPLDQTILSWASHSDILYISAGAIPAYRELKDKEGIYVCIPEAVYKVVVRMKGRQYSGVAFLIPNIETAEKADLRSYAIPIGQLEERLKIQFFSGLPDDVLDAVRSQNPLDDPWWWK